MYYLVVSSLCYISILGDLRVIVLNDKIKNAIYNLALYSLYVYYIDVRTKIYFYVTSKNFNFNF